MAGFTQPRDHSFAQPYLWLSLSSLDRWHGRSAIDVVHSVSLLSEMGVYNDELITEVIAAANSSTALESAASEAEICDAAQDLSLQLCQPPK